MGGIHSNYSICMRFIRIDTVSTHHPSVCCHATIFWRHKWKMINQNGTVQNLLHFWGRTVDLVVGGQKQWLVLPPVILVPSKQQPHIAITKCHPFHASLCTGEVENERGKVGEREWEMWMKGEMRNFWSRVERGKGAKQKKMSILHASWGTQPTC